MPEETRALKVLVFGWFVLAICLSWAIWWLFHLPSPGKGGLLLALVASLMPFFWEKHGTILKSVWIIALFIIFFVEYSAINKDRSDFVAEQERARKEERESFDNLLKQEKQNLKDILEREANNLSVLLQSEQGNFDRTLRQNQKAHRQERLDFSALLQKEQNVIEEQQELYEFSTGKLIPANDPMPAICKSQLREKDFLVQLGDNTALITLAPPLTIVEIDGRKVISIDKTSTGGIALSFDLRAEDGTVIARLDHNGYTSNPAMAVLAQRDKNDLRLSDSFGTEILSVRYLNEHALRISGRVPYGKRVVPIPPPVFEGCKTLGEGRTLIRF